MFSTVPQLPADSFARIDHRNLQPPNEMVLVPISPGWKRPSVLLQGAEHAEWLVTLLDDCRKRHTEVWNDEHRLERRRLRLREIRNDETGESCENRNGLDQVSVVGRLEIEDHGHVAQLHKFIADRL